MQVSPKRKSKVLEAEDETPVAPKGYDFEKMIQEAMEKYGDDPAVAAPPKKDQPSDSNTEQAMKKKLDPKK